MDVGDMIADGFGMALGLGEEIAIDERVAARARKESESDGVLGPPVRDTNLLPIASNKESTLINLTIPENWIVPMTKRLRSPFIEKWKRISLGLKEPTTPLLTDGEESAYQIALGKVSLTKGMDEESRETTANIQKLKKLNIKLKMQAMGKRIRERRYSHGKA